MLENPARVLRAQERCVAQLSDSRYVPVAAGRASGIIMLKDQSPDADEELLPETAAAPAGAAAEEGEEPAPPAPFEFTEAMVQGIAGDSLALFALRQLSCCLKCAARMFLCRVQAHQREMADATVQEVLNLVGTVQAAEPPAGWKAVKLRSTTR